MIEASKVSVIIPVFNGELYLGDAIKSIIEQDYRPIQIIVVDDGSTDGTESIAKSFEIVQYIYQKNQGHAVAKNTGLAASNGEYIGFLDADDLWALGRARSQVEYLKDHPEKGFVFGRMRNFIEPGVELPTWIDQTLLKEDYTGYSLGTLLSRSSVFNQVGTFDPIYWHGNDLDWIIRAKDCEIPMTILPEVFLYRRIHRTNLSQDQKALATERLQILKASLDRKRAKTS